MMRGLVPGLRAVQRAGVALVLLVASHGIAWSQDVRTDLYVTNGTVNSVVESGGLIYIGGAFTQVGPATGSAVPIDASTGLPLGLPKVTGSVYAVVSDGAGGWYVGGSFGYVGGVPRSDLAHLRADGTLSPWNPGANGPVRALAVSGATVWVGGSFTRLGGQARNRIGAVDATTGLATASDPDANGSVLTLALSGAVIYAGGSFTSIGDSTRNRIAALEVSTGQATAWDADADGTVLTLAPGNGVLYAGGSFANIGGQARNRIAALDPASGLATAWNPDANGAVLALAVSSGMVYVGGGFTLIGGQPRIVLAALDSGTGLATPWNPHPSYTVRALAISGGTLYVGGEFGTIGGQPRNRLAAVDLASGLVTAWNPSANDTVRALAVSGSAVCAGGAFATIGGQTRNHLAALDATTGLATAWDPNASGTVYALVGSESTVYAAGSFTSIGGQTRNRLAALDAATGLATAWDPNADSTVYTLAVSGGTVYAGGDFLVIGSENSRRRIAALDAVTGDATAWNPSASSTVHALVVSGETVYAGGDFTSIGGQPRSRIAALDIAFGAAIGWNPDASDAVYALAECGGTIYAGGHFTSVGGQARNGIAALDVGSGLAIGWNPDADRDVRALAVSGSTVYAGGNFTSIGGQARSSLAALDAATGLATAWNPGANPGGTVEALAVSGSTVYAGGSFLAVGGLPQSRIAAITAQPDLQWLDPESGGNGGVVTLTLVGNGLQSLATVKLARSGQPDIAGSNVAVTPDGLSLTATFDLTGAALGAWDVVVTNPDALTATLPGAFTLTAIAAPELRVNILGPGLIRANRRTSFDLVIENPGNVDALTVPLWLTGVPADATLDLDFALASPPRDGGEPDWSTVPLTFTSAGGRYFAVVIPRVPPGTTVRRVHLTVPNTDPVFDLRTAITPPWEDGTVFRGCLANGGITAPACMGGRLATIDSTLVNTPGIEALSGIGTWAKIAWQCEGATTLPLALTKAEQVLDFMVQPIEQPGSAIAACSDVLPPRWLDTLVVSVVGSLDPNEKLGSRDALAAQQAVPYSIRFENASTATAPAQQVVISDPLDLSTLDPSTVSLDAVTFGGIRLVPPPGLSSYATRVDLRPASDLLVDVSVSLDRFTGALTWYFTSIDPATGQPPTDPLAGFLPPNVTPPEGEGSVLFTVMPRSGLAPGTQVRNGAAINFDGSTTITADWLNTIDNIPPASHVLPLSPTSDLPSIAVHWTADSSPPDLRDFTLYVSEDGAPYRVWRLNTTATTDTLVPPGDHHLHNYAFYSTARDLAGNIEAAPTSPDATTQSRTAVDDARPLRLSLEGAHPNPATSGVHVWFTLPSREPTTLDLIDVAGRRVLRREVGSLGPGAHVLTLGAPPNLRAGLYFLRLAQGERVLSARVVVIR